MCSAENEGAKIGINSQTGHLEEQIGFSKGGLGLGGADSRLRDAPTSTEPAIDVLLFWMQQKAGGNNSPVFISSPAPCGSAP